jgi:tetratricopeptide (TPR) repeat protein
MPSKNKKKGGKSPLTSDNDADGQKNLGNAAFQNNEFEKAIMHYSNAIDMDKENPIYYSNRANVYIELEEFGRAIEDSDTAIKLNPSFTRAYFRKATALFEQPHIEGSLEASLATLEEGLATVSEENKEGMPAD